MTLCMEEMGAVQDAFVFIVCATSTLTKERLFDLYHTPSALLVGSYSRILALLTLQRQWRGPL